VKFRLPFFVWRIDLIVRIAVSTQIAGCFLLCVPGIENLTVLVQLQNVDEDGVHHLDCTWLFTVKPPVSG